MPPAGAAYVVQADSQGQLWFAERRNSVYVLRHGVFRRIASDAFAKGVGSAASGYARGARVWFGGTYGAGAFIGDRFHPLTLAGDGARVVTGIVETPEGELWLHGLTKAFHLSRSQVELALAGQAVAPEVFDYHDGLRAVTSANEPGPTLVQDAGGRLWFSTTQGLFWIDPAANRPPAAAPPAPLLGTVKSDGQLFRAGDRTVLPPDPAQTEFTFTAAALGVSDRVQFRYRLEGIDKDWQLAGTRRSAYYTQLPPGPHRFEVVASNEQGVWGDAPAVLRFEVRRAWYETFWFRGLALLAFAGMLAATYRLRVRVLAARERARMSEISAERERIARELHDTLLQGMQGMILGFQSLATTLPPRDDVRRSIEGRLDQAELLLGEARDRVRDLRADDAGASGLRHAFERAAAELPGAAHVAVVEAGRPRPLHPQARDVVYLVGREALLNAAMHSQGKGIELRLDYAPRRLVLTVRDDGVGIGPDVLADGARRGHYGLVGMRERATELRATFTIARAAGGGTEVVLDVPAARAFSAGDPPGPWQRLRGMLAGRRRRDSRDVS